MENFKNNEDSEEMTLLQTIKIPKNLGFLTDKLPQANYEKIPNKRNLSFSNNNEKGKIKLKKNIKKIEKSKENNLENKENYEDYKDKEKEKDKDKENNAAGVAAIISNKKYAKKENEDEEDTMANKRKKHTSLDQSHISGNNAANIKVIKNIENIDVNNSLIKERDKENNRDRERDRDRERERDRDREIEREKSPYNDKERRMKEINSNNALNLPNIKNKGSLEDNRGRNK
jgi:hypothetical protein